MYLISLKSLYSKKLCSTQIPIRSLADRANNANYFERSSNLIQNELISSLKWISRISKIMTFCLYLIKIKNGLKVCYSFQRRIVQMLGQYNVAFLKQKHFAFRAPLLRSGGLQYIAVGGLTMWLYISDICTLLLGCDESCDISLIL